MPRKRKPLPPISGPLVSPAPTGPLVVRAGNGSRGSAGEITITDAGVEAIERLARGGLADRAIAAKLGIARQSFVNLRERDPRVAEAYERGRAGLEGEVVDLLLEQGRNGNVTSLIWLSKNRLQWKDNPTVAVETANIQIVLPAAQSEVEYAKALPAGAVDAEIVE